MKLGLSCYKVTDKHDLGHFLGFLEASLERNIDFFIGPDYSLAHPGNVTISNEAAEIRRKLKILSVKFPRTTILPGTMPWQKIKGRMVHSAFVYQNGVELEFMKQTDHGESSLAETFGLVYEKGKGEAQTFYVGGKKAWLNICGDRGRKPEAICSDSDLEIIIAYDVNAGIHLGVHTPKNKRHIILSDSYHPKASVFSFDLTEKNSGHFVQPESVLTFDGKVLASEADKYLNSLKIYNIT